MLYLGYCYFTGSFNCFMEERKQFMVNRRDGCGINLFITSTEVILVLFCHNRTLLFKGMDLNM